MIIRLTAKLAKKIDETTDSSLPLDENPFADWTARLFRVERVQYIMITNTASLYSTMIFGKVITCGNELIKQIFFALLEFLTADGHLFIYEQLIVPSISSFNFSKALNRGVTGSMNDLVFMAKYYLADGIMSIFDASFALNDTPLSYLNHSSPKKAFSQMKV